ncbi:MAG: RNA degradosome polyphosphate kinase, partial [Winkia neuii]|nr:RNA degradosome polyphosphate kinase [Winkia neuii]
LEHSRVYSFCNGGDTEVWIGSADLMHRNLDRRVEELIRITDPDMIEHLAGLVELEASEKVSSWHLQADGTWKRHIEDKEGQPLLDIQTYLMEQANKRVKGRK